MRHREQDIELFDGQGGLTDVGIDPGKNLDLWRRSADCGCPNDQCPKALKA